MLPAIRSYLDSRIGDVEGKIYSNQFIPSLSTLSSSFFGELIREHDILNVEYTALKESVHKTHLLYQNNKAAYEETLKKQILHALLMSSVLVFLYEKYLPIKKEVIQLQADIDKYKNALGIPVLPGIIKPECFNMPMTIRNLHTQLTSPRLSLVRIKSSLDAARKLSAVSKNYSEYIQRANTYADPAFGFLAWIFFLPRLITNIFILIKHLFPQIGGTEEEASLSAKVRLEAQMLRRGSEILNDLEWFLSGILNHFVFIGPLEFVRPFAGLYFSYRDLNASITRFAVVKSRLENLWDEYEDKKIKATTAAERAEIVEFQKELTLQMNYEYTRNIICISRDLLLLVSTCFRVPFFEEINPLIPLVSCVISVAITILAWGILAYVDTKKPSTPLLLAHGLFANTSAPTAPKLQQMPSPELDSKLSIIVS